MNYSCYQSQTFPTSLLSSFVVILGCTPLFFWLDDPQRESIPLLPIHAFFYSVTFGFAGLKQQKDIALNDFNIQGDIFIFSLICVVAGLLMLYLGYYVVAPQLVRRLKPIPALTFDVKNNSFLVLLIFIGYPCINFLYWFSKDGLMVNLALTFQTVSQFIFYLLMAFYLRGGLSLFHKIIFLGLIFPYQFLIGSGFLEGSIGPLIINLVAICIMAFAIKSRIPWVWLGLIICTIFLIQPIKGDLRNKIWQLRADGMASELRDGTTVVDSMGELSRIFGERYLSQKGAKEMMSGEIISVSYVRMNRLTTLIEVITLTPNPQPYRYGATYLPILTKWIPRLVWKNKPREDLGNEWTRSYGLSSPNDFAYSYNLPWIAEMYMNFGFAGVVGVSFLIGLFFYFLNAVFCCVGNNPIGLSLGVLLMCPLMFPESHLSLLIGGVVSGFISIGIILLALRHSLIICRRN